MLLTSALIKHFIRPSFAKKLGGWYDNKRKACIDSEIMAPNFALFTSKISNEGAPFITSTPT